MINANLVVHNVGPCIAGVADRRIPIVRRRQLLVSQQLLKQTQHDNPSTTCSYYLVFKNSCDDARSLQRRRRRRRWRRAGFGSWEGPVVMFFDRMFDTVSRCCCY